MKSIYLGSPSFPTTYCPWLRKNFLNFKKENIKTIDKRIMNSKNLFHLFIFFIETLILFTNQ